MDANSIGAIVTVGPKLEALTDMQSLDLHLDLLENIEAILQESLNFVSFKHSYSPSDGTARSRALGVKILRPHEIAQPSDYDLTVRIANYARNGVQAEQHHTIAPLIKEALKVLYPGANIDVTIHKERMSDDTEHIVKHKTRSMIRSVDMQHLSVDLKHLVVKIDGIERKRRRNEKDAAMARLGEFIDSQLILK